MRKRLTLLCALAVLMSLTVIPMTAGAQEEQPDELDAILEDLSSDSVMPHLTTFQAIATANGDTRASGTTGYDQSADYVQTQMESYGYTVTTQEFEFDYYQYNSSSFEQVLPDPTVYVYEEDYLDMTYSGSGAVTADAEGVDLSLGDPAASTSGCEPEDFDGFTAGNVALMQRGTCTFGLKVQNAEDADASAAIIFNQGIEGAEDLFAGTLGSAATTIPAISTDHELGVALQDTNVALTVDAIAETRTTANVLAESSGGDPDDVLMVGGHLDSVAAGPGINDNGSGSGSILAVAEAMADVETDAKLRFAWWGAEELGLIGSFIYTFGDEAQGIEGLSPEEIASIRGYLNFDMVASPNYMLGIYDGDGSSFGISGPNGSDTIEETFQRFYGLEGSPHTATEFSGRSDYLGFILLDIPSGGLFTGAEGIKTEAEEEMFGGAAGVAYDECYHQPCDTIDNVNTDALDINVDAIAFTTYNWAVDPSFEDVPEDHLFHDDITWLARERITFGCNPPDNTLFCPEDSVTRGQMAAFLKRTMEVPASETDHFEDDDESIFEDDINAIAEANITIGCNPPDNTNFCPEDTVSRQQMASFLVRAFSMEGDESADRFTDDDFSVHEGDIDVLAENRVTIGCNPPDNTEYCPLDDVTRGQMAAFIHRADVNLDVTTNVVEAAQVGEAFTR